MTEVLNNVYREAYRRLTPSPGNPDVAPVTHARLAGYGRLRRPTSYSGAEVPSVEVILDNADGGITSNLEWAEGRRGRIPAIIDGERVILIDGQISLPLKARDSRFVITAGDLLSPVPLRSASVLGSYSAAGFLPRGFGEDIRAKPVRMSEDGRQWLVNDWSLPENSIRSVFVDDEEFGKGADWSPALIKIDGRVALTFFLAKAPTNPDSVRVRYDGQNIDNPGELIAYILNEIYESRRPDGQRWRAEELRLWCSRNGIKVRMFIDGTEASRRALLQSLMESTGAIWSLGMKDLARPWPLPPLDNRFIKDTMTTANDHKPTGEREKRVNYLEVQYDWDFGKNQPRASFIITAPTSIKAYGRQTRSPLQLRMISNGSKAEFIAGRLLQYLANPPPIETFDTPGIDHNPGDIWKIDHPIIDQNGPAMSVEAALDINNLATEIQLAFPAKDIKTLVISRAQLLIEASVKVEFVQEGDDVVIIATDLAGNVLQGAAIVLSGERRTTNAQGEARFTNIPPGTYDYTVIDTEGNQTNHSVTIQAEKSATDTS